MRKTKRKGLPPFRGHGPWIARELEFQLELAQELGFLGENKGLVGLSQEVARLLAGLANAFNKPSGSATRSE